MPESHNEATTPCDRCAGDGEAQSLADESTLGFVDHLLDTEGFPARWECGAGWTPLHGWLHITSDIAIFAAYAAIPIVLVYFVTRRKDIPFPPVFWLFALFILSCGIGHLIESTIFWHPWYRLSGMVKLITAVVSWATVLALIRVVPRALTLPGLARTNALLETEIAERHAAEAELKRRNDQLEQFVYTISHDLKSPLFTCKGFLTLMREDAAEGRWDDMPDSIMRIERATDRMAELIDDLLQLSRLGVVPNEPEHVDVAAMVAEIAADLSPRIEAAGAQLIVDDELPPITADRVRVQQVMENLLSNAIKYGCRGESPSIRVGAESHADEVSYFVSDNGPGIPAEYQERVFRLFQRLESDGEGTGVGLTAVAKIMEMHGGRVELESAPGRGATFRVTFPQAPSNAGKHSRTEV